MTDTAASRRAATEVGRSVSGRLPFFLPCPLSLTLSLPPPPSRSRSRSPSLSLALFFPFLSLPLSLSLSSLTYSSTHKHSLLNSPTSEPRSILTLRHSLFPSSHSALHFGRGGARDSEGGREKPWIIECRQGGISSPSLFSPFSAPLSPSLSSLLLSPPSLFSPSPPPHSPRPLRPNTPTQFSLSSQGGSLLWRGEIWTARRRAPRQSRPPGRDLDWDAGPARPGLQGPTGQAEYGRRPRQGGQGVRPSPGQAGRLNQFKSSLKIGFFRPLRARV